MQYLLTMPHKPLPEISSPTTKELREMWHRYPADGEVRLLLLEIARARRQMALIEGHRKAIAQAWKEETGGSHLVALYQLRLLLQRERERTGEM